MLFVELGGGIGIAKAVAEPPHSKEEKKELEAEDLEVALAGEDYAEEAAVGGEGVFADGEAVEEHAGFGFEDRDFGAGRISPEFGDLESDEVGRFFFDGAFEIKA